MTLEELRKVLKALDWALLKMAQKDPQYALVRETMSDLGECLYKQHAKIERLQAQVSIIREQLRLKQL